MHPERTRPGRDLAPDPPEADHQDRSAPQFETDQAGPRGEIAASDRGIELDPALRCGEEQEHRLLGDRDGVDVAHDGDRQAAPGAIVDGNVVIAHAVARNYREPGRSLQDLHRQRGVPDRHRIRITDVPEQVVGREVGDDLEHHVRPLFEEAQCLRAERLYDQDLFHDGPYQRAPKDGSTAPRAVMPSRTRAPTSLAQVASMRTGTCRSLGS